ncbi:MAG TPA: DUF126 domain-containing protein [Alphaproteobacteria bacterium]|nr:DUF126 domain-containing protein [Alphaproteobacteria bacterium]
MTGIVQAEPLIPGIAEGPVLRLEAPLSFWGSVDPATGRITQPRHPQCGIGVGGTVLLIPETIGSSSSSSVMLELIACGCAPAALVLGRIDAILALGVVVARELGSGNLPVLGLAPDRQALLSDGTRVRIAEDGSITPSPGA